ncbi:MAG TPA: trehalose-6-phosphate synthase [Xanthobacteraceae bacterium]|nr:trehalose-6-phosphate synthase [Xanthobacteraceae bacterium]
MNVVVVSNRVARLNSSEAIAGGLAAALLPAVKGYGAIWVGSSGRVRQTGQRDAFAEIESFGKGALATVDLPAEHYCGYYEGFANAGLWPTFHSRPDLIRATSDDYRSYREVNAYMARGLLRFCRPDATYWVQDYHFLTLGLELRQLGVEQPIGFFLHTPWPVPSLMSAMPHHREIVQAMLAFDLLGFQTQDDQQNFADYLKEELGLPVIDDVVMSVHGPCRLATFPIGIDVEEFARRATKAAAGPEIARLRSSLQGAKLAIGVDRVDYSKGLINRIRAFEQMLCQQPGLRGQVSLLQIAVPSRTSIPSYCQLQNELSQLVGEVNGRHGEVDWTPVRYINKGFAQATLAGFYRAAHVGLVTPFRDGMNLVAKEYVAAQNPFDPGVLVLSRYAGAAKELDAALLVNPHDVDDVARKLASALTMSCDERRERWEAMMEKLRATSVHLWFSRFVKSLAATRRLSERRPATPVLSPQPPERTIKTH